MKIRVAFLSALAAVSALGADMAGVLGWTIPEGEVVRVEVGGETVWPSIPYATNGLIAMWDGAWNAGLGRHDETATNWVDLSGNGWTATRTEASWGRDCALFDGTDAKVAKTGALLGAPSNLTAEVVYSRTSSSGVPLGCTQSGGWSFWFLSKTSCRYYCRGYAYPKDVSPIGDGDGAVHSLAMSAGIGMTVYFDGQEVGSTTNGTSILYNQNCGVNIGADSKGSQWSTEQFMVGAVYSVRIYSRPLTDAEIARHAAIDAIRFGFGE